MAPPNDGQDSNADSTPENSETHPTPDGALILKLPAEIVLIMTANLKPRHAILFALTCKKHFKESHRHHWEVVGYYPPNHTECAPAHVNCEHPAIGNGTDQPFIGGRPWSLHYQRFLFLKVLERDLTPNYWVGNAFPGRPVDEQQIYLYPKRLMPERWKLLLFTAESGFEELFDLATNH
ncbi:hypothetical protein B0T16DRAFT_453365 [Cercophora newfieldiana]|uniref:F-box domain-containing protein n=1 Tax=Cercophora newfieldiana TaxID=92897 RepID=A0AA40D2A6_9PEZI|nr:hypothetical protein B0T16DRAFT_453365 [Cercophora newfieldiana]